MSLESSSLPDELISEILEYTDCKTLLSCRTSCRRLKNIVDQSSTLQYILEVFGSGMCDGQLSGVGSAERLDRLRRSQTAWKSHAWREPADFPYWKKIRSIPAAVSGNLMVFYSFASSTDLSQDLLLLRFPSELRGIPERQWSLNLDCNYIHSICVDDSQDLLCFISIPDVHVRTLSTGETHPLTNAVGPVYSFASEFVVPVCLQIYDDLLMLAVNSFEHHTLVFNWRTGGHVAKIPSSEYTQCAFLDRTTVILSCDIYKDGERILHLRAVTLPNTADDASLHSYDFEVPTPKDNGFLGGHTLCANTLPSNNSASYVPGLFHADPRGRLLALERETLVQETFADRLRQHFNLYVLYIPHDTILSYIKGHTSNTETVVVPWQTWGPGNTRLIKLSNATLTYPRSKLVCGMHALTRHSPLRVSQGEPLRIMDYHARRVARILDIEDMYSPGKVYIREGPECPNTTAKQRSGTHTSRDEGLPYALKEIPLPSGLEVDMHYELGEDVAVLIEDAVDGPTYMDTRIKRVFYHHI